MGRKKVECKARNISICLPYHQIRFIENHEKFNLSEFVRIHLQDYLDLTLDLEECEKEVGVKHDEETID